MKKIEKLKASALESAKWRGHRMTNFSMNSPTSGHAFCLECPAMAFVDSKPGPNGIDVSGEAVAINCKRTGSGGKLFHWRVVSSPREYKGHSIEWDSKLGEYRIFTRSGILIGAESSIRASKECVNEHLKGGAK